MEDQDKVMRELLRLTTENNNMLHAMRRNAFLGGIIKLLIYAAMIIIPFWLYLQYLAPQVDRMVVIVNQIQGTTVHAQSQMTDWQKAFNDIKSKIPGLSSSTTK